MKTSERQNVIPPSVGLHEKAGFRLRDVVKRPDGDVRVYDLPPAEA